MYPPLKFHLHELTSSILPGLLRALRGGEIYLTSSVTQREATPVGRLFMPQNIPTITLESKNLLSAQILSREFNLGQSCRLLTVWCEFFSSFGSHHLRNTAVFSVECMCS